MPDPKAPRPPRLGEIARDSHGLGHIGTRSGAFTDALLDNPDSVLASRGADLAIYDEMLRDDQVKSTLQQRRAAVTRCEWEVVPAQLASKSHNTPYVGVPLRGRVEHTILAGALTVHGGRATA